MKSSSKTLKHGMTFVFVRNEKKNTYFLPEPFLCSVSVFKFAPILLGYNWHTAVYKFKVYSIMI